MGYRNQRNKRAFTGGGYPIAKRMRYIEKQVYRNRAEMQTTGVSTTTTVGATAILLMKPVSSIISGSGPYQRNGDKIRVFRIECRGTMDQNLDAYIIQKKGAADPTVGSFGGSKGAYIITNDNTNRFTEWKHCRPSQIGSTAPIKFSKSFKGGMEVSFNASTTNATVNNEPIIVIYNTTGTPLGADLSTRVWYTDA